MGISEIKIQSIIFTTVDLIDEYGIQAISTREVAKRQGISHGAVFQYFPKKNDLLCAVLDHFSLYDNDLFQSTKIKKMKPKEAIIFYIDSYMTYYENYPAITAVSQAYEVLRNDPELGEKAKGIFLSREKFMKQLIEEAQAAHVISLNVDSGSLADIITSTMRGICLKWRIEGYSFPLREKAMKTINMLLDAFST